MGGRSGVRKLGLGGSLLLVLTLAACNEDSPTEVKDPTPGIVRAEEQEVALRSGVECDSLAVPAGQVMTAQLFARGDQVYRWDGATWVFVEPVAKLYLTRLAIFPIGDHYVGPHWEMAGGSKVMGSVTRRCTAAAADIPWLLLRATPVVNRGLFKDATWIQRINTQGGIAPSQPGTAVGEVRHVKYTADYRFYRAK